MLSTSLIPIEQWIAPRIEVDDAGAHLSFHLQDAFNYHGYDAVGGVVLGFRLLQKAIALLSPTLPLQRRRLHVFTAFPGTGFRDCIELVTRAVTENRFTLDIGFTQTRAQQGVQGRLHFAFSYQGRTVDLSPVEGALSADFISLGRASKQIGFSPQQQQDWRKAKFALANALLSARPDDVIRVL